MSNLLAGIKVKPEVILVENIETNTFVRSGISDDRVCLLHTLVEAGTVLEPILLIPEYKVGPGSRLNFVSDSKKRHVVDGRHRLRMYDVLLDQREVKALTIFSGVENEAQLISLAFRANNVEGPLPPDNSDISHTVELLLERNVPKKDIPTLLGLPEIAVRKFINDIESRLERAKVYRAFRKVVNDGLSVLDAAKSAGTTPEKVRVYIVANKRKVKEANIVKHNQEMKGVFRSLTSKLVATMSSLMRKYDDGDVAAQDVLDFLKNVEGSNTRVSKTIRDSRARFEAKLNGRSGG